jgi:probable HAF family extracellular repeat protein
MVRHLLKKRLMWGMVIAIGIAIAIVGPIVGDSLSAVTAATKPSYTIKALGYMEFCRIQSYKINNAGQVVGSFRSSNGFCHAFKRDKNKRIDLGTLGGRQSYAYNINNAGKVVGIAETSNGLEKVVLWDKDNKIDPILNTYGDAVSINDAGQMVGFAYVNKVYHAILWDAQGSQRDLGASNPSVSSKAYDINNAGQVVGESNDGLNAVLWDKGKKIELKTLGGRKNSAYGINNEGKVVGRSQTSSGKDHAVLWDKDSITDLGEGAALSINKAGQVVGHGGYYAVLWEKGLMKSLGSMIPPNSGWALDLATDINDSGQIVGIGRFKSKQQAFLLTPIRAK